MNIARYPSSITDAQWAFIKPMLPEPKKRGRPPTDRRQIIDAILYVLMGGIQWRMLPSSIPPWQPVYHVFHQYDIYQSFISDHRPVMFTFSIKSSIVD